MEIPIPGKTVFILRRVQLDMNVMEATFALIQNQKYILNREIDKQRFCNPHGGYHCNFYGTTPNQEQ